MDQMYPEESATLPAGLPPEIIRELADRSAIGFWNWHIASGKITMTAPLFRLVGHMPDDMPHSDTSRDYLVYEEDRPLVARAVDDCVSGKQDRYVIEYRMRRKDGSIVSVRECAMVYRRDAGGTATHLAAVVQDLSARKLAESRYRQLEAARGRDTASLPEGQLLDENHLLRIVNEAGAYLIGGFYQDYETVLTRALQILAEGMRADRIYIYRNIVEAEENADSSPSFYQRAAWASQPSLAADMSADTVMVYADVFPQGQGGFAQQKAFSAQAANYPPGILLLPGAQTAKSMLLVPLHLHGSFWGFLRFDDCNQGRAFTETEAEILASGVLIIVASIFRNETFGKLNADRDEALASTRAKSDFLSRMSHEIRTPMNAIIGMATIAKKTDDIERIRYCLDKIDVSSRQLLGIINDVLDMSKIDADKFEISNAPFDFEKMMQNVFSVIQVKLDEKHQDLHFDCDRVFSNKMVSDELRLSQVLINLLNNAIKFTPECGRIVLKVREHPVEENRSRLHVEVIDNGVGISKEGQARLFQSFEQADGSITRQYGGTGLGLAICKKIVNLMGGDIWVESQPGHGSTFAFEIEVTWGEALVPIARPDRVSAKMRILVVDDSDDVLEYFHNILGSFSLQCDTAPGGAEAVKLVRQAAEKGESYDMIFIDWNMPQMNGGSTAQALRQIPGNNAVVVMISVADWSDIEKDAKSYGVDHFLAKPVLPSMLYNTIVELTENTLVTQSSAEDTPAIDWHNKRILLVEDIEINREIVISILEDTGISIDCAVNGQEAVSIFRQSSQLYDLILMDVQMPVMDGLQATRMIRQLKMPKAKQIPIIAMTANAFKEDAQMCLDAGMNGHVAKPIEVDTLVQTLQQYLNA